MVVAKCSWCLMRRSPDEHNEDERQEKRCTYRGDRVVKSPGLRSSMRCLELAFKAFISSDDRKHDLDIL